MLFNDSMVFHVILSLVTFWITVRYLSQLPLWIRSESLFHDSVVKLSLHAADNPSIRPMVKFSFTIKWFGFVYCSSCAHPRQRT